MDKEKQREYLQDITGDCGCYVMGDWCYDKNGVPTHASDEECNN